MSWNIISRCGTRAPERWAALAFFWLGLAFFAAGCALGRQTLLLKPANIHADESLQVAGWRICIDLEVPSARTLQSWTLEMQPLLGTRNAMRGRLPEILNPQGEILLRRQLLQPPQASRQRTLCTFLPRQALHPREKPTRLRSTLRLPDGSIVATRDDPWPP